jgi:hypothetical protein
MTYDDWLDDRADILAEHLLNCGVAIEAPVARELVANDVVATALGRERGAMFASELVTDRAGKTANHRFSRTEPTKPGDSMQLPTDAVPFALIGQAVAGLSEAALSHLETTAPNAQSSHLRDLLELMQILGERSAESPSPEKVSVPAELMWNVAARLDDAAQRPDISEDLASVWRRDAMRLRAAASRSPLRRTR